MHSIIEFDPHPNWAIRAFYILLAIALLAIGFLYYSTEYLPAILAQERSQAIRDCAGEIAELRRVIAMIEGENERLVRDLSATYPPEAAAKATRERLSFEHRYQSELEALRQQRQDLLDQQQKLKHPSTTKDRLEALSVAAALARLDEQEARLASSITKN